jgi:beta-ureidopropionase
MENPNNVSRRNFLKQTSLGLGAGLAASYPALATGHQGADNKRLPSEICVASIDLLELRPEKTREARIQRVLARMEDIAGLRPDIICLPELFDSMWVSGKETLPEMAEPEDAPGPVTSQIAEFAKKHGCYVVCPVLTKSQGHYYNSSLLVDRKGAIAGVYHKTHVVKSEMLPNQDYKGGVVTPGALRQPVLTTDFGKVGIQICYDANWSDGWDNLKQQGAAVVFFPSAFPGGRMLNYYAQRMNSYLVSATGGDARIVDMSGNDLDASSIYVRYAWAVVNLEKVTVTTWPARDRLPDIFRKYGQRLGIKVWDNTGLITIESRDPQLKVRPVLQEFSIPTYEELISRETSLQDKHRPKLATNK